MIRESDEACLALIAEIRAASDDGSRQPECDRNGKRLAWPIAYGGGNQRAECEP